MQAVSDSFISACAATVRQPRTRLLVRWNATDWTDESANLLDWQAQQRLSAPGDELAPPGDVGRATVGLFNVAGRYSWRKADGALAAYLGGAAGLGGKQARLQVGFGNEYITVFTGVVRDWAEDDARNRVTLTLADMGYSYLQQKVSTRVFPNQRADQWIAHLATLAGIPSTTLDTATHVIPYCWTDDESILEEIWAVAGADGGRAYFDLLGGLRYETPAHWLGHALAWTFDLDGTFAVRPRFVLDEVAATVIADWSPRAPGMATVLYKLDTLKAVGPGETLDLDARLQYPCLYLHAPEAPQDYYISSASGSDLTGAVSVTITQEYAQRATVRIVNGHATQTAMIAHLQLRGYPLLGSPSGQVEAQAAADPLGQGRVRTARGNPYRQTAAQAQALAHVIAARASRLRAVWPIKVQAVPQLELGDKVRFSGRRTSAAVTGYVIANRLAFSATQGLTQELDVLDETGLYDHADFYAIGATALGAGRVWF